MNSERGSSLPARISTWTLRSMLLAALLLMAAWAQAQKGLVRISTDPFTNPESQHATEVEPDTFAFGSTMVSAFQTGRIYDGGCSDIGFATSTDAGATWKHGFLPGITKFYQDGTFLAVSDPSVAYDSSHGKWLIASLGVGSTTSAVLSSSSSDALHWGNPVIANDDTGFADKPWIACDNNSSSTFFGHCYLQWDDRLDGGQVRMSTSTDGGQTWSAAFDVPATFGTGGQPLVQPNGTVIVPFYTGTRIQAFTSTDGGTTWNNSVNVAVVLQHVVNGNLRTESLPSAEIDKTGTVYVVWQDCRFRSGCSSNDIVMSKSSDGKTWSQVSRIPIDPVGSTVDHFIPGIAVDPATSGNTAHVALTFYFYPVSNCTAADCKLGVGFVASHDGGATWARGKILGQGMSLSWVADTSGGPMVGDYISTSFVNGKAFGVFAGAQPPNGSKFREAMYTPSVGLLEETGGPRMSSASDKPVPGAKSDRRTTEYQENESAVRRSEPELPPLKR